MQRDLVQRARDGDGAAFALLVRDVEVRALSVARRASATPADAEDAFQDACVKAWRALGGFDAARPFAPWFLTIVEREARNRRRGEGRRRRLAERAAALAGREPAASGPEEAALRDADRDALRAALAALPPADREVLALRHLLELSEAEAAAHLGVARGTVKSRTSRALARLRAGAPVVVLALLVAGALLAASPGVRATLRDWLGVGAVRVERVDAVPPLAPGDLRGTGVPVDGDEAARRLGRAVPAVPPLGPPSALRADGISVLALWAPRRGLPAAAPGVGALLELVRGDGLVVLRKLAGGGAVRPVRVGTARGYVVAGPHGLVVEPSGPRPPRLAGTTVVWVRGGVTLRLETALGTRAALALARAVRP